MRPRNEWAGRRVLVMGLGLHGGGLAVTRWLLRHGAVVRVTDTKTRRELAPTIGQLPRASPLRWRLGGHQPADFRWAEVVVQNPAVPRASPYLAVARRHGAAIENEATLFFSLVPRERIVGVTGTRGKSTTAALAAHLLRQRYPRTLAVGNIGVTPMLAAVERIRRGRGPVVVELSSWHLENLGERRISPRVAVVTNVLPDHADRYRQFAQYVAAKRQILAHQTPTDVAVLNWDNPVTRRLAAGCHGRVVACSLRSLVRDGSVSLVRGRVWRQKGKSRERLFAADARQISGQHNLSNILAATAVALEFGVPRAAIASGIATFRGLPFRQEVVAKRRGVTFMNDTTATTPEATIAALRTLMPRSGSIILIAGGSDKKLPAASFRALAGAIADTCKLVVLLEGQGSERISRCLPVNFPAVSSVTSMVDAVAIADAVAQPGDTVLLSPACASFGLFLHEFDRGDQFNACVKQPR